MSHTPVLLRETIDNLVINENDIVCDGTLGSGGHAVEIVQSLSNKGKFIGIDADKESLERGYQAVTSTKPKAEVFFIEDNFRNIKNILQKINLQYLNKVVLDLGWNSEQFKTSGRGFSFQQDEPLLMTYSADIAKYPFTAKEIINTWEENNIADILYYYSDEYRARKIARTIIEERKKQPIETSLQLATIIEKIIPRRGPQHPARKTFQALRMTVNDEIGAVQKGMENFWDVLQPQGRMAIITFHSVEDTIVKKFFKEQHKIGQGTLMTKHVIKPKREEILRNKSSRSAKLRVIEKNTYDKEHSHTMG